jgi:hypothetical protein
MSSAAVTERSHATDLVYLCDWLPPDFGAVGQYALQFCREEAQGGKAVALYGLSSAASAVETERHGAGSLRIVRLKAPTYDRGKLRARAWWTLKTDCVLVARALRDLRATGAVLFTGSPPFLLHFLAPLNVLLRKKLVYRITDFYPECLIAEFPRVPLVLRLMRALTRFWRRRITQFEVLGEDQRRRLLESGIASERIVLRRDPSPVLITPRTRPLPRPEALRNHRILLYSGNFGVAHDYRTFLEGYRRHHREGSGRVALWLNAVGRGADALEQALRDEGLPHLRTRPVALENLAALLVTPDAHLITLREPFWGYVLPSKVYGCIASRRPVLFIGPSASDVLLLCRRAEPAAPCLHVEAGDGAGVLQALQRLGD